MNDIISVIIPVYNAEKFLDRCINSLIHQTYNNLEIIIVNDGSTDNSLKLIKKYMNIDSRIILINKENSGVSASRNIGLEKSNGKYIMLLDADDWLNKDAIEILYKAISLYNVDVVRGNYRVIDENNNIVKKGKITNDMGKIVNKPKLLIPNYIYNKDNLPCYSVLLLINSKYKIKFNEDISFMEDTIFYYDMLNKVNTILMIPNTIYNYYQNSSSRVNNPNNYKKNIEQILKVNKIMSNKEMKDINKVNTKHITIILSLLNKIYIMDKKLYYHLIDELFMNKQFNYMLENLDITNWNILTNIKIKLLMHKQFKILGLLFKLNR